MDIDVGVTVGQFGNLFLQLFDFRTLFANDDSRASCVNVNLCFVSCSFDFNPRDACMVETALQKFFNPKVFMEQLRIVMTSKPLRVPSFDYAETKNSGVCFLTHQLSTPLTDLVQHDGDMTQAFADTCGSALRSRRESLPHTRFIHLNLLYIKTIHIDILGVLRIGYCRIAGLCDQYRRESRN